MGYRLDKLSARRHDPNVPTAKLLNEVYTKIHDTESVKYVVGAMQPIDPEYTRTTIEQGERVRNQLEGGLYPACSYRYQGSVTNDTHIKAASDIDLLTITEKYFTLQSPQQAQSPYEGDPLSDLRDVRKQSISILKNQFPAANVAAGSKAITIQGGSLSRKVDVVPANWYDTVKYSETGDETFRGIQILDNDAGIRIKNTPFLHNYLILEKNRRTKGGMCKVARLFKSVKFDTESVDLSSYDLVSLVYNMSDVDLSVNPTFDLALLEKSIEFTAQIYANSSLRTSLMVPDGHRQVFCAGHATLDGLAQLVNELTSLRNDVMNENQRSFKKLAEARVAY